jgi:hypothetical protein
MNYKDKIHRKYVEQYNKDMEQSRERRMREWEEWEEWDYEDEENLNGNVYVK